MSEPAEEADGSETGSIGEVARVAALLGLLAVGGPNAHLAIFQDHLVERRRWLSTGALAEMYALCSMLPGPTSTQTLMAACIARAGALGGVVGLLAWAAPAVAAMTLLALGVGWWIGRGGGLSWLIGLQAAAVGVLLVAAWRLGRRVVTDQITLGLLLLGAVVAVAPAAIGWDRVHPGLLALRFPIVIAAGGVLAAGLGRRSADGPGHAMPARSPRGLGVACAVVFAAGLVTLPAAALGGEPGEATPVRIIESFYRNGSLIFGGGQVLLPLIYDEYVLSRGWVSDAEFWTGFGVVQGLPGPLFAMSAFLGGAALDGPAGGGPDATRTIVGAVCGAFGLFLPGALLVFAALPAWGWLRQTRWARAGIAGVNATAVGLLVGAAWIMLERTLVGQTPVVGALAAVVVAAAAVALLTRQASAVVVVLAGGLVGGVATALI